MQRAVPALVVAYLLAASRLLSSAFVRADLVDGLMVILLTGAFAATIWLREKRVTLTKMAEEHDEPGVQIKIVGLAGALIEAFTAGIETQLSSRPQENKKSAFDELEMESHATQTKKLTESLDSMKQVIESRERQVAELQMTLETKSSEVEKKTKECEELQAELARLEAESPQIESEARIRGLGEEIQTLTHERDIQMAAVKELQERIQGLTRDHEKAGKETQLARSQLEDESRKLTDAITERDKYKDDNKKLQNEIEALRQSGQAKVTQIDSAHKECRKELQRLEVSLEQEKNAAAILREENLKLHETVQALTRSKEVAIKERDTQLAVAQKLRTELATLQSSLTERDTTIDQLKQGKEELESRLGERLTRISELETENRSFKDRVRTLEGEKTSLERESKTAVSRIQELEKRNAHLEKENHRLATLESTLNGRDTTIEQLRKGIRELESRFGEGLTRISELEKENGSFNDRVRKLEGEKTSLERESKTAVSRIQELEKGKVYLETESRRLAARLKALGDEKAKLEKEKNASVDRARKLESEKAKLERDSKALAGRIGNREKEVSERDATIGALEKSVQALEARLTDRSTAVAGLESEREALKKANGALQREIRFHREESAKLRAESAGLESERGTLISKVAALVEEKAALESKRGAPIAKAEALVEEKAALISKVEALVEEKVALISKVEALVEEKAVLKKENEELERGFLFHRQESARLRAEKSDVRSVKALEEKNSRLQKLLETAQSEKATVQTTNDHLLRTIAELKESNTHLRHHYENSDEARDKLREKVRELSNDIQDLQRSKSGAELAHQQLSHQIESLGAENKTLSEQLVAIKKEKDQLKVWNDNGRKHVKSLEDRMRGMEGSIARLRGEMKQHEGMRSYLEDSIVGICKDILNKRLTNKSHLEKRLEDIAIGEARYEIQPADGSKTTDRLKKRL